jgi:citronellyl-CoA synthetase
MFIRRKFSGSNFLSEVREHGATCFIYIGELCRYLLNVPAKADDRNNPLMCMMGNGLRPDVWHEFKARYGIKRIAEFYGSSEGNVAFLNMLNKDCTVGTTSLPLALVKYDVDADEIARDAQGRIIKVADGEPGLLLGKITEHTAFEGYTSSKDTEKKILRDAFEKGDAWFNTGDLMKTVDVGFSLGLPHYQFVDRVGDTFRWKSENVSTNEVGEIINGHVQVDFCNVYGVEIPKADGRAGMASLVLVEGIEALDVKSFSAYVNEHLPAYARPVFLRIQRELDTTGTFKMVKGELRKQSYDLDLVSDPIYVLKPRSNTYELLDREYLAVLRAGDAGY